MATYQPVAALFRSEGETSGSLTLAGEKGTGKDAYASAPESALEQQGESP